MTRPPAAGRSGPRRRRGTSRRPTSPCRLSESGVIDWLARTRQAGPGTRARIQQCYKRLKVAQLLGRLGVFLTKGEFRSIGGMFRNVLKWFRVFHDVSGCLGCFRVAFNGHTIVLRAAHLGGEGNGHRGVRARRRREAGRVECLQGLA